MLPYEPGDEVAHGLDPRAKLAFQLGFASAAFAHPTPRWLLGLTAIVLLSLGVARTNPIRAAWSIRFPAVFLALAPIFEGIRLGAPWFSPGAAWPPALASYRVGLILLVSVAYVRTTSIRETRAAIQLMVPGRAGQFLGVGVALVARFLPVLRSDFERSRDAVEARLGERLTLVIRLRLVAVGGLRRAFARADRLSMALRARCFAWNPTQPALSFRGRDYALLTGAVLLAGTAFL